MTEDETPGSADINTYHCLCTTLVLATPYHLEALPKRAPPVLDGAIILPPPVERASSTGSAPCSTLYNVVPDRKAIVVRREDGFEKRTVLRCSRCKLMLGYNLDSVHFEAPGNADADAEADAQPVYLLPGGLSSTSDMRNGQIPPPPDWATDQR